MKRVSLKGLSFDQLVEVRDGAIKLIASMASKEKRDLQERLARLETVTADGADAPVARRRGGSLKGRKVPPKYRNPQNRSETWAGRGAMPRWLSALVKEGKKVEDFAIEKTLGRKAKKGHRKKRA
jgi:DNA-binding protein H-NS